MSYLVPQFKCQPVTFGIHFRTQSYHAPNHTPAFSKNRELIRSQTQCSLSTASPPTLASPALLDLEKLRLPSIESISHSVAANRSWIHTGTIRPPEEKAFGAIFTAETLITSDEAVIAAAAAKAVTLARDALRAAKDAALMVKSYHSNEPESKCALPSGVDECAFPSGVDASSCTWSLLIETEQADIQGDSLAPETGLREQDSSSISCKQFDYLELTKNELGLLQKQLSECIAVRSRRLTERRARRARAAEKATVSVVSAEPESTNKKRFGSLKHIDYSDRLPYMRRTISTSRSLSVAEELKLSEGIQDLLKLERLQEELRKRCGREPSFAQWAAAAGVDQKTLSKRLNYGIICKNKMISCNLGLVISIAKKYQGAGMDLQDLVQEGCRGLVRAAEKFDASKGFKFSTYAHWWIKKAVRKSLSDQSRTIRLPSYMVEATYRVKEATKRFFIENGRQPDDEEIAEASRLSMKRLNAVLQTPKAPRSLDQKMGPNMDLKPLDVITDPAAKTSEELLVKQHMIRDVKKVLDSLSPREYQVIRWRFGMEDGRVKNFQEIGELMGVSRERIRQIELSAFRKLKNKKGFKQLKQYLLT
nr:plastidic RNA polymerase sigma-subunit 2 [Passiflora pittieri]